MTLKAHVVESAGGESAMSEASEGKWWHVDIDATKAAAHRLGEAVVLCGGEAKVAMRMGEVFSRFGTVLLVVRLAPGQEGRFREIVKPIAMKPPPVVDVGADIDNSGLFS